MLGPARQAQPGRVIEGAGDGPGHHRLQKRGRPGGQPQLHPLDPRPVHIHQRVEAAVEVDQVMHPALEVGHARGQEIRPAEGGDVGLHPHFPADALLRPQLRIAAEEAADDPEALIKRGRVIAGADGGAEPGGNLRQGQHRAGPPGGGVGEAGGAVMAEPAGHIQPVPQPVLQAGIAAGAVLMRVHPRHEGPRPAGALRLLRRMGHAEGERTIGRRAETRQPDRVPPIQQRPLAAIGIPRAAGGQPVRQVGVAPAVLGRGEAQAGGPGAAEQRFLPAELAIPAAILAGVIRVIARDAVEPEIGLPPAQQPFHPRPRLRRPAQPGGGEIPAEAVPLPEAPLEARRGRVGPLGREVLGGEQIVECADRPGGASPGAEAPVAAAGELAVGEEGAVRRRPAGDEVHHPADRRGAIERGGRAAQDLDPLHIEQQIIAEVEGAIGLRRVVQRHAIQQHQDRAGGIAANEAAGLLAEPPRRHQPETGHRGQRLGEGLVAPLLDIAAGEDGDGGGHALLRGRHAGGGDDGVRDGLLGTRRGGQRGKRAGQGKGKRSHRCPPCGMTNESWPKSGPGRRASFPQTEAPQAGGP